MTKLVASDAQDGDFFGESVSVSGDTAFVGAPGVDAASTQAEGAAYVFDLLLQKPTPTVTPTSTVTPTPTPTRDPAVGGIALDSGTSLRRLETPGSPSYGFGTFAWVIAAAVSALGLGSAAWYVKRRQ